MAMVARNGRRQGAFNIDMSRFYREVVAATRLSCQFLLQKVVFSAFRTCWLQGAISQPTR